MVFNVLVYYMYNTPNNFFVKGLHEKNTILFLQYILHTENKILK